MDKEAKNSDPLLADHSKSDIEIVQASYVQPETPETRATQAVSYCCSIANTPQLLSVKAPREQNSVAAQQLRTLRSCAEQKGVTPLHRASAAALHRCKHARSE